MLNCHFWRICHKEVSGNLEGGGGLLNATSQLLTHTFCLLGKDINITKKNTEGMLVARKEGGMNINVDRAHFKHMLMFLCPLSGGKP